MEPFVDLGTRSSTDERELKGRMDIFGGITVYVDSKTVQSEDEFDRCLSFSIKKWRQDGVRGVWMRIGIKDSVFIPIAVKHGFVFHHTKPTYIMLTNWLPVNEPNPLPRFGDNYIGVAGFVVDDNQKLLVVRENFFKKPHWKLPGGMADQGEEIPEVAIREVHEETGIKTEFISMLAFRHKHDFRFGCGDLYFICVLKPLNLNICFDTKEIKDCRWMKVDEYIASPLVNDFNRIIAQSYKDNFVKRTDNQVIMEPVAVPSVLGGEQSTFMFKLS